MNYKLLCDIFRKSGDYISFISALNSTPVGKRKPYLVSGLSDGAEYIYLMTVSADTADANRPLTLVFNDEKKASSFRDLLVSNEIKASFFPQREYCFNNISSSHDIEEERLLVLSALSGLLPEEKRPSVICTTAEALLQVTVSEEGLRERCVRISYDEPVDTADMAARLSEAGYTRVELVESVGQFAVRGSIIDVYPPGENPVRIELFGDDIDRMGHFSAETQRFTEMSEAGYVFPPVKELVLSGEKLEELKGHISSRIRKLGRTAKADEKYARAAEILRGELSSLEHGFEINFADKYLPVIYPDGTCTLDYIRGNLIVIDAASSEERYKASCALTEQSIADMTESLELPACRDGIYTRSFDEIIERKTAPVVLIDKIMRSRAELDYGGVFIFNTRHVTAYDGNISLLKDDLARFAKEKYTAEVICENENQKNSMSEMLTEEGYSVMYADSTADFNIRDYSGKKSPVLLTVGEFVGGFELADPKFVLMNLSGESARPGRGRATLKKSKKKKTASEAIMSYADLEVGDIVVHDAYGIGQYMGIENLIIDGSSRDYVHIKYAGSDKLFLPADQLDHVSKYIGAGADTGAVKLSKMGGADWNKAKSKAKSGAREMARELIALYAERKRTKGIAFEPDDDMCREFADSFAYEETDGQLAAIEDIRRDMEKPYPMDRLICGDVGYGKTEVALRAAFKAVMSGKQVALLVPTTILAYQHYRTFLSRMRAYPVNIDMLSRFRTQSAQQATLRKIKRGECDIIIGTHRLISKDVEFADLGLIIIDEEQRFGVAQKEKLKRLSIGADVLTLTATPIPRTLNMAMGGIVDMSVLEEAPGLRSPVQTYVMEFDEGIINEAIRRELRRGGQVFYLYNNTAGIYGVADRIAKAIPEARIAVAHGKMDREDTENIWDALVRGEVDVLVCTTIIETGVDIPNANTLIIENAENYGLSQLHQIRGRVGRSSTRAFAYFTYRRGKALSDIAEKRLAAIREFAEFGAGFRIALRDLEIRGAGNLLGAEQHGHMEAVGYDLYMKLLEEAVVEEKGGEVKKAPAECAVDIRCDAYLSKNYISSAPQRMDMYKRIARIDSEEDYNDLIDELCDRYGEPNFRAMNLCRIARIRALGRRCGFTKIDERDGVLKLFTEQINAASVQLLASAYPTLGVRVMLGQTPYIVMKMKKNVRNTEFIMEVLLKYLSFSPN